MKPGDIIEWVYQTTGEIVEEEENLMSSAMRSYIPVGRRLNHILISENEEVRMWMNEIGIFRAHVRDTWSGRNNKTQSWVIPRKRNLICKMLKKPKPGDLVRILSNDSKYDIVGIVISIFNVPNRNWKRKYICQVLEVGGSLEIFVVLLANVHLLSKGPYVTCVGELSAIFVKNIRMKVAENT